MHLEYILREYLLKGMTYIQLTLDDATTTPEDFIEELRHLVVFEHESDLSNEMGIYFQTGFE